MTRSLLLPATRSTLSWTTPVLRLYVTWLWRYRMALHAYRPGNKTLNNLCGGEVASGSYEGPHFATTRPLIKR